MNDKQTARTHRMSRALVRNGDPTTTGGVVIATTSSRCDGGKPLALDGEEATCGKCKGIFKIFGTCTKVTWQGRASVFDGDLVLCPCGQNRVIAGPDARCFAVSGDRLPVAVRTFSVDPEEVTSGLSDAYNELEHYFEMIDAVAGVPVEGMTYTLLSNGYSLVKSELLVAGKTVAVSRDDHPDLRMIAWRSGSVR
ncbi:PAAR domain-containing protein [Paraburkholderia sp. J12]|uniref:PAAR domain-containing protein n=1 Tax=Paraburkholderia sp. J12 TaxID=2805432 RepID=UPI002ABDB1CF|nr:PAAR domain-containing protein [Paraburkholderia sp. J12]